MTTSVAMTTYNGSKYIVDLLDSIRKQDLMPDEVIIVDDRSSDGTYELVRSYTKQYNLVNWSIFQNKYNIGWKANFREAFKKCTGDLIFLCDQDDIWMPYKINEMKSIMEKNTEINLLISNYSVKNIDREEKVKIYGLDRDDSTVERMKFKRSSLTVMRPGCTFCVRKELINKLWNNDIVTAPHDAMLWGYAAIDETLYLYNRKTIQFRRHSESASTPQKSLCRTRRIEEVKYDIEIGEFFLKECKHNGYVRKGKMIENQLFFNLRRKQILENKSFLGMLFFQIKYHRYYATLRNMLSDDYVLLIRRK